jgi:hypothetical protein
MILTDSLKVKNSIIIWHEKINFKETAGRNRQIEKFGTNYGAILSAAKWASRASVFPTSSPLDHNPNTIFLSNETMKVVLPHLDLNVRLADAEFHCLETVRTVR